MLNLVLVLGNLGFSVAVLAFPVLGLMLRSFSPFVEVAFACVFASFVVVTFAFALTFEIAFVFAFTFMFAFAVAFS